MRSSLTKQLIELVGERRATSSFSSSPVRRKDLDLILRAGLEAPSSYNLQPWRFVVVRDRVQRRWLRAAAMDQQQVEQAPVLIVACGDTRAWKADLEEVLRIGRERGVYDGARVEKKRRRVTADLGSHPNMPMWVTRQVMTAATTMMWMAEALGYDTGPIEGFYEDRVREALGIPEQVRVILMLAVGRLRGEDDPYPGRLPATRTLFAERYGRPLEVPELREMVES